MAEHIYDPAQIESKWQKYWEENSTNKIDLENAENPYYILMMFPYPSAEGLHVGNVYAYTGADIHGRYMRLRGKDVFEPIGFDAFGIHSENFAMKINRHPRELIPSNIKNFTRQLKMMGFMFDWDRTVDTTTPEYYKWTQWIFVKLYKAGYVYRDTKEVNFCPDCGTVIADEQVNTDGTCERHGDTMVERRMMPCWFFRITKFAERLAQNHLQKNVSWSRRTIIDQLDWIGRSEGAEVIFEVDSKNNNSSKQNSEPNHWTHDEGIDEKLELREMAANCGMFFKDIIEETMSPDASGTISRHTADIFRIYPLYERSNKLCLATSNPFLDEKMRNIFSRKIEQRYNKPANQVFDKRMFDTNRLSAEIGCDLEEEVEFVWTDEEQIHNALEENNVKHHIRVFTTRPDTLFGATFMVLSPEHPLINYIADDSKRDEIEKYRAECAAKTEEERTADSKEKTGVYIGANAINPVNGQSIPIYIADYVLMGYGTGAIMAVPSGDHRDFAFAKAFDIPVKPIIEPDMNAFEPSMVSGIEVPEGKLSKEDKEKIKQAVINGDAAWSGPGLLINSENDEIKLTKLPKEKAIKDMTNWLSDKGAGNKKIQFRLRDWGISRQRYWGPPVPVWYDQDGNHHPIPEDQLPVTLPDMDEFRPKGDGKGPLAKDKEWMKVNINGVNGTRETDVMDNFLDSAWYFLRYISANNPDQPFDPKLIEKWLPIDMYIGGNEHAKLHLMYTRFICMALTDAGVLKMGEGLKDLGEPFRKFRAHGLLIKDGGKMSKSKGNIVNPDDFVASNGSDTLRTYLMFLGPYEQGGDFRDKDIAGIRRFFNRVFASYFEESPELIDEEKLEKSIRVKYHQTVKKVTLDCDSKDNTDGLNYNTAIAALMELHNEIKGLKQIPKTVREGFIIMLAPFAPHLAEEVWHESLGYDFSIFDASWPTYEEKLTELDEIEVPVQINGKIKDRIMVPKGISKDDLEKAAMESEQIKKQIETAPGEVRKIIVVPGRLVNIIVK